MAQVAAVSAADVDGIDDLQYPYEPVVSPQATPQRKGNLASKLPQQTITASPSKHRNSSGTPSTMASTFYTRPYRSEDEGDDEKKEESSEPPSLRMARSETMPVQRNVPSNNSNSSSISSRNGNHSTAASQGSSTKKFSTAFRNDEEEDSQPPSLRTNSHEYKDPFFESPQIGKGQSNASAGSVESSAAAELAEIGRSGQQHQRQPQHATSNRDAKSPTTDPETLLKVHIRSSMYGTTAFYLPVSLLLAREKEMKKAAQSFGITAERWSASLLYRTYQLRHKKHQYSAISFVSENSEWRTIELDPETECAQSNFSHSLTWEPWLTACIRAYYNTGSIRIPDECIGSDILLALEYFGIVYAPDQLVFDSFGAYLRVKLWSDYFTHRAVLADWVVQKMLTRSVARHVNAFCTCLNEQEAKNIFHVLATQLHQEKRLEVFHGGLTLDPVKYDNIPSCAVVHDFFTDTTSSTDSVSTTGIQLDSLMRDDFRSYLQTSLPGTQILFDMEQIQMTNPATGQTEPRYRAVLHIDVLPPVARSMSPTPVAPQRTTMGGNQIKTLAPQPTSANLSAFTNAEESVDVQQRDNIRSLQSRNLEQRVIAAAPVANQIPPKKSRNHGEPGPSLRSTPSKDTQGSIDDEVAQLTLPKSNSMFVPTHSRPDFGDQKVAQHSKLSLPNAQSYDEKMQRKQILKQKQQQQQQSNQPQRSIRLDPLNQQQIHRKAPTQQDVSTIPNPQSQQIARRVGGGVELRPTPSVDHIYIELGTDTNLRGLQQNRLPPRSPRNFPDPRNAPSSAWNEAQSSVKKYGMGMTEPTEAAAAAPDEPLPSHSRRKPQGRKMKDRYVTDTEDSLFHMSDIETDPHVPVGVVVAGRGDVESVASTLSGPLTVDEWPTLSHARSFATPVDTLSVAEKERVIQQRQENHRQEVQRPVPSAHLTELQQLSSAEQEDFYRWQQRQLQRRRLQQQQEEQKKYGKLIDPDTTPVSTPDRSSSLFTQQTVSVCQNVAWLDYLCEAMRVPGSDELPPRNAEANRAARSNTTGGPAAYGHQPRQVTPTSSTDETSSPAVVVPQVRRNVTYPEMDPSPSTAWISDAFNFVRSVLEGDVAIDISTVPQERTPIQNSTDDQVLRARSPTLVADHLERTGQNVHPVGTRQQASGHPVGQRFGPKDQDDNHDKYRTLVNESDANQRQKRVSFDQQDTEPVVVKAKSWSQPFHIVAGQEPAKAISPRNNPRSIPLRERPPIDSKALPKGTVPNQRPQSAPRTVQRTTSQPQKSQSEDKGEKKRGAGLKGLFGFLRKKNVATD